LRLCGGPAGASVPPTDPRTRLTARHTSCASIADSRDSFPHSAPPAAVGSSDAPDGGVGGRGASVRSVGAV